MGKNLIVNEEQAEIVRFIYSEYLNGKGTVSIADELTRREAKTSTGLTNWSPAYISRVLRNPFYSGTIVYRKSYIPDYLEQKPKMNYGEVEQVITEGKHEPLVSKEDFKKVQQIMDSHSKPIKLGRRQANGVAKNIWSKKLVCECGSNFNRKIYHKNKNNTTYCYVCYNKKMHPKNRFKESCEVKEVQEWKLQYMSEAIFRNLTQDMGNRKELYDRLMKGIGIEEHPEKKIKQRINDLNRLVEKETAKLDKLIDSYLDQTIDLTMYDIFQKKLSIRIEKYKIEISELEKKYQSIEPLGVRVEKAKASIRKLLDINYNGVDEKIIEEFIEKIIVYKDYFEWKLNFMNDTIKLKISGKNKSDCVVLEYQD